MAKSSSIVVKGNDVRHDPKSDFICITDLAKLKGDEPDVLIANWLRTADTVDFIQEWEQLYNVNFKPVEFDRFTKKAGRNAFRLSAKNLMEIGCIGIYSKRGRNGGTYAAIQWAIHFANWMDPAFYLATLDSYIDLQRTVYGEDATRLRFSRELAAKNYKMITQANSQRQIPNPPDPHTRDIIYGDRKSTLRRHLKQVDADILNLALWKMTAKQWRARFQPKDKRANMRDFATTEELNTMASLQVILRHLQEDQYSREEMLDRLTIKAKEFIKFYCDTPEKIERLKQVQKQRNW
ncbi:KilA-N domain-containing protein [Neolewinella persica]|uniref:KilA-N domain-containing protein n=1 Tax=Neolewinella persica TaxID=70998 RepID=UPI00036D0ADE|nr:KilA-N domain-containing protein [Neolewinella persica]